MRYLIVLVLAGALLGQRAETLLQAAIKRETVDGDLAGAIGDYKKALTAAKGDRAVAAKALYGMAQCYRKQGDAQARAALERVVREYGDQPVAGQARAQLAALGATAGMRIQKTRTANNMDYGCSSVSADGRLLGCALGHVNEGAVYDIASGQMRVLTEFQKAPAAERRFLNTYAVSPDGKWLAFHNYRDGAKANEISIVATDGAGGVRTAYKHPEDRWLDLHGWTPDSREVVFTVAANRQGGARTLTVAAIAGGASRAVREHRANLQQSFAPVSPDGKWIAVVNGENVELWPMDGTGTTVPVGPAIDMDAVAGWAPDGRSLLLIASDGHRGELLQYPIVNGRPAGAPRRIRSGAEGLGSSKGIDANGTLHFSASFPDSDIFGVSFDSKMGSTAGAEVQLSTHAPRRQAFGAWSPDGKIFSSWTFYSHHNMTIRRPQLILKPLGGGPETMVTPERAFDPYSLPVWDRDGKSLLVIVPGDETGQKRVARMDPVTGKFEAVTRAVPAANIGYTPTFSLDLRYLYQRGPDRGLVRVDARTGETTTLYKPAGRDGVRSPAVSPDRKTVAFFANPEGKRMLCLLNAETGTVRHVEMEAEGGWGAWAIAFSPDSRWVVWTKFGDHRSDVQIVPVDGSAPPRVLVPEGIGIWKHLAFSPDGKMLSFTRDVFSADTWALSGFLGGGK